jgi:hypothetical protein
MLFLRELADEVTFPTSERLCAGYASGLTYMWTIPT